MAVKYEAGDVFAIPLQTGGHTLCQVLWAPQGDYRKVLAFCVLQHHAPVPERRASPAPPLPVRDGDKDILLLFTGTKKLRNGEWKIIGHEALSDASRELLRFHIAGALHEGVRADAVGGRVRPLSGDVGAGVRSGGTAPERQPVIDGAAVDGGGALGEHRAAALGGPPGIGRGDRTMMPGIPS